MRHENCKTEVKDAAIGVGGAFWTLVHPVIVLMLNNIGLAGSR